MPAGDLSLTGSGYAGCSWEQPEGTTSMLIAMAGLPATGKSALAARLAAEINGVVLCKDQVRAALFPPPVLDYTGTENEISMDAIFTAVAHIRTTFPQHPVLIDGRTFLRSYQVHDLFALASSLQETPRIIECACSDEVTKKRLQDDLALGTHPARNRTYALYMALKARAEPIRVAHLVLDTGVMPLEECVQRCLAYLQES
jgi:dephospho-CoA kinase